MIGCFRRRPGRRTWGLHFAIASHRSRAIWWRRKMTRKKRWRWSPAPRRRRVGASGVLAHVRARHSHREEQTSSSIGTPSPSPPSVRPPPPPCPILALQTLTRVCACVHVCVCVWQRACSSGSPFAVVASAPSPPLSKPMPWWYAPHPSTSFSASRFHCLTLSNKPLTLPPLVSWCP